MILFFYIITVGFTSAALGLSLLYWMQKRNSGRLNTFAFILYLTLLLLLGGVRFYWEDLLAGEELLKLEQAWPSLPVTPCCCTSSPQR